MEDRLEGPPVREAGRLMQSFRQERPVAWTRVLVGKMERSFAFWIYSGDRANRTCR